MRLLLFTLIGAVPVFAQGPVINPFPPASHLIPANIPSSGPGSGTVTSVATGCGLTGGPITATGTLSVTGDCYVAGGGSADAQTATYSPAATLTAGFTACWLPIAANVSTTPTFAPNGLTAHTIVKAGGSALAASDLTTTAIACAIYNTTGTRWELQNPQTPSGSPSSGASGTVQLSNGSGGFTGDPLVAKTAVTGGAYFSATADANGGAPNQCPIWYWGDNTCQAPSGIMVNSNLSTDLGSISYQGVGVAVFSQVDNTNPVDPGYFSSLVLNTTALDNPMTTWASLVGINANTGNQSVGHTGQQIGFYNLVGAVSGGALIDNFYGNYIVMQMPNGSVSTNTYGDYVSLTTGGPLSNTNAFMFYSSDIAGQGSNLYYSWFDSRGVRRVKEDNTFDSVGQAIECWYNPLFAKYTPGAADYERGCTRWNGSVVEIGVEKGGTGTLRELRLIGQDVQLPTLAFASLGTPSNSAEVYCSDCTVTSGIDNTCAASGTGAIAYRLNGAWKCQQ